LTVLCLLAPQFASSQEETGTTVATHTPSAERNILAESNTGVIKTPSVKEPVASEIAETGMVSYGNFKVFGAAPRCNIWTAGVEYDRHSWGYHLKAQVDYVAEVLPFVVLSEPLSADKWGNPTSPYQQLVPGVGVSPFGFRFLWRSNQRVKPFLIGKIGVIAFPKKILAPSASYANFNFQGDFGLQIRMTDRTELRVDPLIYFHVSNGYLAASNPGFDQLGAKFGISYHLGGRVR
jgi:Lipid A 3-O-deacylase (PagL)